MFLNFRIQVQRTPLLYKWFKPMGSVVIIQMTPLRGREKQCQYFCVCVERTIKEKQIILCGLINSSTHAARRMNIMHFAQLTLLKGRNRGKELWFLLFLCSDPSLARRKRVCQNLKCDIERKSLVFDKD